MKTLILSDIHSNIYALEAIWRQENDCDLVACTGDLVDYGSYPREVVAWMKAHKVICTMGNHDQWVAMQFRTGSFFESMPVEERTWAHHNASLLTEADVAFLESLPIAATLQLDGTGYGLTHLYQEYDEIVSLHAFMNFRAGAFKGAAANDFKRLILGHTHRQSVRYLSDEVLWLNPGSVSYRRRDDPDQTAHYITITDRVISLKRQAYDLEPLRKAVQGVSLKESEMQVTRWFFGNR